MKRGYYEMDEKDRDQFAKKQGGCRKSWGYWKKGPHGKPLPAGSRCNKLTGGRGPRPKC